jgi:hypothetical protein
MYSFVARIIRRRLVAVVEEPLYLDLFGIAEACQT